MDSMEKVGLKMDIPYRERISRLFVFRGLWVFVVIWPMIFLGFWVTLLNFVGFWYMLILGKRAHGFWDGFKRYFNWNMEWSAYLNALVDKRPNFWW